MNKSVLERVVGEDDAVVDMRGCDDGAQRLAYVSNPSFHKHMSTPSLTPAATETTWTVSFTTGSTARHRFNGRWIIHLPGRVWSVCLDPTSGVDVLGSGSFHQGPSSFSESTFFIFYRQSNLETLYACDSYRISSDRSVTVIVL